MDSARVAAPSVVTIGQIQGADLTSPLAGKRVTTKGVVTSIRNNGFYLQAAKNEKAAGSRGIFVYTGREAPTVKKGDQLKLTGDVIEFQYEKAPNDQPTTQLGGRLTIEVLKKGLDLDTVLGQPRLVGKGGLKPATVKGTDGISFWEGLEGERVTLKNLLVVGATNYGKFMAVPDEGQGSTILNKIGELVAESEDDVQPEAIAIKVVHPHHLLGADAPVAPAAAFAGAAAAMAAPLPSVTPALKVGDRVPGEVTGVVTYDHGAYVLEVEELPKVVEAPPYKFQNPFKNRRPDQMLGVTINVENLSPVGPPERFDLFAKKYVDPDIYDKADWVALQEIQDNDGPADTGTTSGELTGKMLADAVLRAGGPKLRYIEIAPGNNQDGGEPGGNIRCAYLIREDRIKVDEKSIRRLGEDSAAFKKTRKSLELQGTFLPTGKQFGLIDNHTTSNYGSESAFGVHQPPRNPTVDARKAQNKIIEERMIEMAEDHPGMRVLGVGDFNESATVTERNTPVSIRKKIKNVTAAQTVDEARSYNYMGLAQTIDQVLAHVGTSVKIAVDDTNARLPHGHPDRDSDHGHVLALVDMS